MGGKSTVWIVFKTISWLVFGDFVQLDSNVSNGFLLRITVAFLFSIAHCIKRLQTVQLMASLI